MAHVLIHVLRKEIALPIAMPAPVPKTARTAIRRGPAARGRRGIVMPPDNAYADSRVMLAMYRRETVAVYG